MSKKLNLLITIYFLLSSLLFQYSYSDEETDTEEDEFSCASEDFPFLVAIVSILTNKLKCEGSLIDSCWVLTAAHCLTKKDKYRVVAGLSNYPVNRIEREANEIFIHPQYSESKRTNDIGLIKFTEPIPESPHVKYILIPIRLFAKSYMSEICERGLTVKWGHENTSSPYRRGDPVLSSLTCCFVPMTIKQNCKVIFRGGDANEVDDCIEPIEDQELCEEQTGGPLLCASVQTGIMSWGKDCGGSGITARGFTRIDKYLDFINTVKNSGNCLDSLMHFRIMHNVILLLTYYFGYNVSA